MIVVTIKYYVKYNSTISRKRNIYFLLFQRPICFCIYINIYIYIERERERYGYIDRDISYQITYVSQELFCHDSIHHRSMF